MLSGGKRKFNLCYSTVYPRVLHGEVEDKNDHDDEELDIITGFLYFCNRQCEMLKY